MAQDPDSYSKSNSWTDHLGGNLVWFALGLIVMGIAGTVTVQKWLDGRIEERIKGSSVVEERIKDSPTIRDGLRAQGLKGDIGPQGVKGEQGPQGPQGPQGTAGVAPSGAVIAFDLPGGCPLGWSFFEEATSRVIIGAVTGRSSTVSTKDMHGNNLTARQYRADGGEEVHLLTIPEMPPHTHGGFVGSSARAGLDNTGTPRIPNDAVPVPITGAGQPHNNMPPYLALIFCRKD